MFISIPKEFFVPVLFSDKFILNLENNNMEYEIEKGDLITAGHRASGEDSAKEPTKNSGKGPVDVNVSGSPGYSTEGAEEKAKVEKEMNLDKSNDGDILSEADEEFIHMKSVED